MIAGRIRLEPTLADVTLVALTRARRRHERPPSLRAFS